MINLNVKVFIYIFLLISASAWFLIILLTGLDVNKWWELLRPLPSVATIVLFLFAIFTRWVWRWKVFQSWLVPFPNLSGTWEGSIHTTWSESDNEKKTSSIPVILTIKQSFLNISCVMRTAEMTSYSYAEGLMIQTDSQIKKLAYSYTSNPNINLAHRSMPHDGTVVLDIIGNPVSKLTGHYWTTRKTTGEIYVTFRDKKLLDEIPEGFSPHPLS
jgi:hypothetical protein